MTESPMQPEDEAAISGDLLIARRLMAEMAAECRRLKGSSIYIAQPEGLRMQS
jgi:hypothetical protein